MNRVISNDPFEKCFDSPFKGKVSFAGLMDIARASKNIFSIASDDGYLSDNPFNNVKFQKFKNKRKSSKYLSQKKLDSITQVNKAEISKMGIHEQFQYLLPKVMVGIGYETAARSFENRRLCREDIGTVTNTGLVPISIIGGKARSTGNEDIVWIEYWRIKELYELWLEVSDKYYKVVYGSIPAPIEVKKRGNLGTPLFGRPHKKTGNFSVLSTSQYRALFKKFMIEHDIAEILWSKTHCLRYSRITNWILEGWDFYNVHKNARHVKFDETEGYVKALGIDLKKRVEKDLGLDKSHEINGIKLPDESMRRHFIYKTIVEIMNNPDCLKNLRPEAMSNIIERKILADFWKESSDTVPFYTSSDLERIWGLKKMQCIARMKILEKDGYLHFLKDKQGRFIVAKAEVARFEEEFIDLAKAAILANSPNENFRKNLRKILASKKMPRIKVGNLWFPRRKEFNDWLIKRNRRRAQ